MSQPFRLYYLVKLDGKYFHTAYTPAQTAAVQQLLAQGISLDAIAVQTGIPYSSLGYVAALEHRSLVVTVTTPEDACHCSTLTV